MLMLERCCCIFRNLTKSPRQPLLKQAASSSSGWKCCPKTLLCVITIGVFILWLNLQSTKIQLIDFNVPRTSNLKFLLMWTSNNYHPFNLWKSGQDIFIESQCPVFNCYVTNDRQFFGGDITKFDAIAFNGRNLQSWDPNDLPKTRSPHQKYVYINMESSDNYPICSPIYDRFFNWTATYKLNSDVVFNYLLVMSLAGQEIGPRINMTWVNPMSEINNTFMHNLKKNKSIAVAWFVSNCSTRSKREEYAYKLKKALRKYNLTLDVYGDCGPLKCPRAASKYMCEDMLRDQYFFYLSFENSFAEYYVTEKVLMALENSVVPVVYGGANYSRFLPPGSYLDARSHNPKQLARLIATVIASPATFYDYFRWRYHYTYHYPQGICRLCAALKNDTMLATHTVYDDFRTWWHPNHQKRCLGEEWELNWFENLKLKIMAFLT